jgi:hypothetical protein
MTEELLAAFVAVLATDIHMKLTQLHEPRLAYCVVINYGEDASRGCIPVIGVGFLNAGEPAPDPAAARSTDEGAFWNPAEFANFGRPELQPDSAAALELSRKLASAAQRGEFVDLRALANRIAARLDAMDWTALPHTADFIVYAVDDDLVDLEENIQLMRSSRASP